MSRIISSLIISTVTIFVIFISMTYGAPIDESRQQQKQQQQFQQENQEYGIPDNRLLMKMKKWFDAQNQLPSSSFENSWNGMHYFPGEKRMDDKFIVDDYPNLAPGRLEWNFNRL